MLGLISLCCEKLLSICSTTVQPLAVSEADENRPRGTMPLWLNCSAESHAVALSFSSGRGPDEGRRCVMERDTGISL